MATTWRERNRAKWVGMRPGHDGEQVSLSGNANNAIGVMYTVPAGSMLLLFEWYFECVSSAVGYCTLRVRNTVPAVVHTFGRLYFSAAGIERFGKSRFIPWEVPEGYTVEVFSSAAGVNVYGYADGILIPA